MSLNQLQTIIYPTVDQNSIYKMILSEGSLKEIVKYNITIKESSSKKGDSYLSTICRFSVTALGKNQR